MNEIAIHQLYQHVTSDMNPNNIVKIRNNWVQMQIYVVRRVIFHQLVK